MLLDPTLITDLSSRRCGGDVGVNAVESTGEEGVIIDSRRGF